MKRIIVLLVLGIILLGCTQTAPPSSNGAQNNVTGGTSHTVHIKNFAFSPTKTTVNRGDIITWINEDTVPHRIGGPGFLSPILEPGDSYQHMVSESPGEYEISCTIHPSMGSTMDVIK
ncbi:Plastocyanin [Candidatus Bilamarchaeum dharawalense]|uniref:Plastocyanin n=1 Tax=Candidatus Bilamarchaeum dharawalense TaxID=2885759 RepID=A0A5E4LKM6_9ARCH|nr:Plastocyanin [Candidatus Bilamarchaeum dharawalense]